MGSLAADNLACVRRAREDFLTHGIVPVGVVNETIIRSWQRSAERGIGMERGETRCTPRYDLMHRRDKNDMLLLRSQPVMENLYHEICGTSSMVLLADREGVILHSIGDPDFVDQAQKVYLKPGGIWTETVNGTNAIGTALEEQTAVHVHSSEHFIDKNRFLSCSATPIFDPRGAVLGALDVSGDYRSHQKHTMALVRMSAQLIENQMFVPEFPSDIVVCFHLKPEFIGTLYEGIAVFSPDGSFIAANRSALLQFGLDRGRMVGQAFASLFKMSFPKLLEQSRFVPQPVVKLPLLSGIEVHGRVWCGSKISPVTFLPVSTTSKEAASPTHSHSASDSVTLADLEHGDPAMQALISKALKVVGHDIPIMIEGESGTGKELLARGLHQAGPRNNGPFVALNCASIPEGLFESELFGYQEGAFTGARRKGSIGKIREADGGTLFLDEIGEMPLNLQARLLRVLQDRTVSPLGGSGNYQVSIAVICATNRRVRDAVAAGKFREDLYYRLNGMLLTVPSLRARHDRVQLSRSILDRLSGAGRQITINEEVLRIFEHHPWPGNIRQMHNILRTAVALIGDRQEITIDELPEDFLEQAEQCLAERGTCGELESRNSDNHRLSDIEAKLIASTLNRTGGNIAAAARSMGIGRNTLYRKIRNIKSCGRGI
ncbi:MAG TPA: sigma-54-dependent Fis family transcriptional regulator [Desulfuromonadales bacterium]|nr:sigma-54-dependent Fis family transcriptional regulator [Desulfuromonadales bacterium]